MESSNAKSVVSVSEGPARYGLGIQRMFTGGSATPYEAVDWETRDVAITNEKDETIFEQKSIEVPARWSRTAATIAASKYFRGKPGTPQRERSVRQMVSRVVETMRRWGVEGGYFSQDEAVVFGDELAFLLLNQYAAFNSPVWFNCGVEPKPQCSACFINSVQDSMESILNLTKVEGMLFKFGSGAGVNLSPIRSSRELLSTGGKASGPVSFMRGYDAFAGVIKSGGRTRRAAKMVVLNVDHPDIVDFIRSKEVEEDKAGALIDAGYDGSFNVPGGAYDSIAFQNENHSVRVTDEFMRAVENGGEWSTKAVTSGLPMDTTEAGELFDMIAEAAHACGDPGLQFDTTVNRWHTCPATARINASNPCSEFMFIDDSACNLSSLNLMKFRHSDGSFDAAGFRHAVSILITAQEIIVDNASYPTPTITQNSHDFRPLGLGYANLGALLMAWGLPYDSEAARATAAAITALMTGTAYAASARLAAQKGPFKHYAKNREPFLRVMEMHRAHAYRIDPLIPQHLLDAARGAWDEAIELGRIHGYRNAQTSAIAPTGTIGLLMDCDTTGIEPDIALVKHKKLVGGGTLVMINNTVGETLAHLGYAPEQRKDIMTFIEREGTIEGAPHLKAEHLPVFDCAFRPVKGVRTISPMGHVKMMAAVQPFISGGISKTVNLPSSASVRDIRDIYMQGWKLGLKCIAVYRDGSKRTQPLTTSAEGAPKPIRRRLPDERMSITHKFSINSHEGYITVGEYEDGQPGEIFITMAKEGSTISGVMDCFATAVSLALQYGVPLKVMVDKFCHTRFEPSGMTNNKRIQFAKSVMDYIFRWLAMKFLPPAEQEALGILPEGEPEKGNQTTLKSFAPTEAAPAQTSAALEHQTFQAQSDAPPCSECGTIMVRVGSCYRCPNCGITSGCG